jgi:hypothetical protein
MTFSTPKPADPQRETVRCRDCRAKTELMVSMMNPRDGRTLRIFRCQCGRLTTKADSA